MAGDRPCRSEHPAPARVPGRRGGGPARSPAAAPPLVRRGDDGRHGSGRVARAVPDLLLRAAVHGRPGRCLPRGAALPGLRSLRPDPRSGPRPPVAAMARAHAPVRPRGLRPARGAVHPRRAGLARRLAPAMDARGTLELRPDPAARDAGPAPHPPRLPAPAPASRAVLRRARPRARDGVLDQLPVRRVHSGRRDARALARALGPTPPERADGRARLPSGQSSPLALRGGARDRRAGRQSLDRPRRAGNPPARLRRACVAGPGRGARTLARDRAPDSRWPRRSGSSTASRWLRRAAGTRPSHARRGLRGALSPCWSPSPSGSPPRPHMAARSPETRGIWFRSTSPCPCSSDGGSRGSRGGVFPPCSPGPWCSCTPRGPSRGSFATSSRAWPPSSAPSSRWSSTPWRTSIARVLHRLYGGARQRTLTFLSAERVIVSDPHGEANPYYALAVDGAERAAWGVAGRTPDFERDPDGHGRRVHPGGGRPVLVRLPRLRPAGGRGARAGPCRVACDGQSPPRAGRPRGGPRRRDVLVLRTAPAG